MSDKFFITTPIFYPNGVPHIGHAYTAIATDVLARFQRLDGKDSFMLTGTDEHGQKMQRTAEERGITPQQLADENAAVFQKMVETFGCSHREFIRTTEERHAKAAQALWKKMEANGDIYLDTYGGWYSVRQEAYFDESETTIGEDGVRREPLGSEVEWVEEESYYFKLSAYGEKLIEYYEQHPDFIAPQERRNEVLSFVKSGLRDLSISRTTFDWGIPVPGNDDHVMYVWVDALTNYLTAAGYPNEQGADWGYWPATHIIGKDIIRFHAVYWPAFLMSAGVELPKRIYAHGFLFNKGEKMSKSVGNVIDPFELVDLYGLDKVRYFFMREVPFGNDGSYSHDAIITRTNADLANGLGNLAQRSLSMIAKNLDGVLPEAGDLQAEDKALIELCVPALDTARQAMDKQQIHKALEAIFDVVSAGDRYVDTMAPWGLKKTDPARMATVLYTVAETVRRIAIMCQPIMPESAGKLLDLVAVPNDQRQFANIEDALVGGTALPKPEGVFPRHVETKA
ncbi:methionine--tRNA ligase [Ahrensia marina]|uniref:Methionine--tRNA ligase n=1 Tax=Ahrensia marina TaxID=1514904 RepID=A0A0N0VLU0_9HYPH|nr:methionine--tRNA ligase [Ahrensia marina]KPB01334.1 methionine--tRNA ligase [Ahrensia marina]